MVALAERQLGGLPVLSDVPIPLTRLFPTRSAGLTRSIVASNTQIVPPSSATAIVISQASSIPTISTEVVSTSLTSSSSVPSTTISETPTSISVESTSTPAPVETTTPDAVPLTVTSFTTQPGPSASVQAAPANSGSGFLQNKVLSGLVFAIVGVVALILIVIVATIAIRRSRRRRLVEEAVSFDPAAMGGSQLDRESFEKRRFSLLSSEHAHGSSNSNHGTGFGAGAGAYIPPSVPTQAAHPRYEPHRFAAPANNQYGFGGNPQQPWYGYTGPNDTYGAYLPPPNLGTGWTHSNEREHTQRSGTPVAASDRARSPESQLYRPPGHLKVANV